MKNSNIIPRNICIHLLTDDLKNKKLVYDTLAHAYPGIQVETYTDPKNPPDSIASINIIDTCILNDASVDYILDMQPDLPIILVVEDFASLRKYSKYLLGRRSVVTHADLGGMGLIQTTHHLIERQRLHEQLRRTSMHLKELAIKDDLTNLFNNRHFHDVISNEVKKANRYKRPLGLIIFSIKNFRDINKTFGHHEGDRILAKVSDTIRNVIRDVDVPARYGDNEFAIILPESDEEAAKIVVTRIQNSLEEITLKAEGEKENLILSYGIAALSSRIKTKQDLLRTVLSALIEAKRNGENIICTSEEIEAKRNGIKENRQLIEQLNERLERITNEAQKNYFQSLMKAIGEIPFLKRQLMPHSERVAFFGQRIAEAMGLSESRTKAVYQAGLLHDTGMLAIDSKIITKPDKLSIAERDLVKQHPLFAIQIIGKNPFLGEELDAILHHHERFDGEGYPQKLSGEAIPVFSRIIAVAEAWDVMTTTQPYRKEPLSMDLAMTEIKKCSGKQFDPQVVDCFAELITG